MSKVSNLKALASKSRPLYLIFKNRSRKLLLLWSVPVISIPLLWPAYAYSIGNLDEWIAGVYLQTHRISQPLINSLIAFLHNDPVLFVVGIAGVSYSNRADK